MWHHWAHPHVVVPFAVEDGGVLGKEARRLFFTCRGRCANKLLAADDDAASWSSRGFSNFFFQKFSRANPKGRAHFFYQRAPSVVEGNLAGRGGARGGARGGRRTWSYQRMRGRPVPVGRVNGRFGHVIALPAHGFVMLSMPKCASTTLVTTLKGHAEILMRVNPRLKHMNCRTFTNRMVPVLQGNCYMV